MVILSLFDGMSCGAISLYDMGIIPDTYYASEVDKHAIEQTRLNWFFTYLLFIHWWLIILSLHEHSTKHLKSL